MLLQLRISAAGLGLVKSTALELKDVSAGISRYYYRSQSLNKAIC